MSLAGILPRLMLLVQPACVRLMTNVVQVLRWILLNLLKTILTAIQRQIFSMDLLDKMSQKLLEFM